MTERERLIAFMQQRRMDYRTLARLLRWSPTYIYGFLGGAWSLTEPFRVVFRQTFGDDVAEQVFANGHATDPMLKQDLTSVTAPAEPSVFESDGWYTAPEAAA